MWLLLLVAASLAGEPTLKGARLLDDGQHVLSVKTRSVFGSTATTLTTRDGAEVVVFSLAPAGEIVMMSADFSGLGLALGAQLPPTQPGDLVLEWWRAGVLTPQGADRAALQAWAGERQLTVRDTAADRALLEAHVAANPEPRFEPAPAAPSQPSSSAPAAPSAPSTVSVQFHIECDQKVRLFRGSSPTSGGTYGWEYPNTVRSTTMRPGDVLCICDDRDKVQSCWTAGEQRASLEVTCGGFRTR